MLENKKVIIFDLDGTLIDSVGIWNKIDEELIKTLGTVPFDNVNIGKQRDSKLKEFCNEEDIYLEYCGFLKDKYGFNESKEETKKIRYDIAHKYLKDKIDYKTNAEDVLKYLKEKGYILAIASTTNDYTILTYKTENENIIKKANFDDYFTLIYSKGAVKNLKPNPEVHLKILDTLNVKPEECLIIEDSLIGTEAAVAAKIDVAIMYDKYSDADRDKINELSNYQFNSFNELLNSIKNELEKR